VTIDRIDHVVLTVRDIEKTCEFYARVLGMQTVTFEGGRRALRFGEQKINLHEASNEFEPKALHPTPGSADLCFITNRPLEDWIAHLKTCGVTLLAPPSRRSGAEGPIRSIYFRDPDQNLVEVSNEIDRGDRIAPLRAWLRGFGERVRAVDFEGGRRFCAPDLIAFGTVAEFVEGIDRVMDAQWRRVWPNIRDFPIRADEARGDVQGDHGWVAAPWDSLGVRPDGATFRRPGRLTIVFARRDGRWLATHTHFSLSPPPPGG
jgi:catechol 2,3-dioxygenase-like lactoylglutathione lyase family enzyme/ketosteroid isomerase-like protein